MTRHKEHFSGNEEKFNTAKFNEVIVFFSVYFNGSSLDDVESQLITYFVADNPKKKQNIGFDDAEVINLTSGNSVNEYKDKEKVSLEVVLPLWEETLYPLGWVKTRTLSELRTKELVKYSPIKGLTNQQVELISEITNNPNESYVVNGDAGTGKTVLLTHLVATFLQNNDYLQIAVVVQPNWINTAKEIFSVYGMNNSNLTIATSTNLINSRNHFDVIIVDESHKLSRKYGKQQPSFNSVYKIDEFKNSTSHLEILKSMGDQLVLMYDVLQAIRPANITRSEFKNITAGFEKRFLTTQFRIKAPKGKQYTSDDYINGIKYLLYKDTELLKETNFDIKFDRSVFSDQTENSYFGFFTDNPLHNLTDWVEDDRNFNPQHINRILAGLVEPWKQSDGKDITIKHWNEGDLHRRWNSTQENWINSTDEDAEDQIGSVFAVQGIDLNKVGVIIGNDIEVDASGKLVANREHFHNVNGKFPNDIANNPDYKSEFTILVLNIYYVLLTRGIDGVRLGFWKNKEFIQYMKETLDIS